MKLGNLEINLNELSEFIVKAKKNCYAANCDHIILPDGSKQLIFQEGDFHYTDNYAGFYQAPGTEIVRWQKPGGQRIWQMSYSGGMLEEFWENEKLAKETFSFLKEVLSQVTSEKPFRGPHYVISKEKEYIYSNESHGDLKNFEGYERIQKGKDTIFTQDYIGGLVIPK